MKRERKATKPKMHFRITKDGVEVIDVTGAGTNCSEVAAGIEKALNVVDEKASAYQDLEPIRIKLILVIPK